MSPQIAVALARLRMPAILALACLLVAGWVWPVLPGGWLGWISWTGIMAAFVLLMCAGTLRRAPVAIRPPVAGRWLALNSPASRVPSHGVQAYGQCYAIDLIFDPPGGSRPGMSLWPSTEPGHLPPPLTAR